MIANITSLCLRQLGHNGKLNLTGLLMRSLELAVKLVLKMLIKTWKNNTFGRKSGTKPAFYWVPERKGTYRLHILP